MRASKMTPPCAEEVRKPGTMLRCAIYTRKSTEEGLQQEFNSLDAQRESAEAYVLSQRHAGWTVLAERYDDGGYTGANLERPALERLLQDIDVGKIDAVIVYKVDRLSRSLLDFARLMGVFEKREVSLVSVTQQFNTTASLGRLTLNILLSFAQFEREIIGERTRDKMAAARRKGKWTGGIPMLGYDVAAGGGKLVVNEEEAAQVRAIFGLYLEHRSVARVLAEVRSRQWTTKHWSTREGKKHPGRPFTRNSLKRLLSSVVYLGQVIQQGKVYGGEQAAIVEKAIWRRVKEGLAREEARRVATTTTKQAASCQGTSTEGERVDRERVPRITRLLALALKFDELVRSGVVPNYAVLGQLGEVSRSRITQMSNLLNLAPDIQEEILFLRVEDAERLRISEPSVRKLSAMLDWEEQRAQWRRLQTSISS
jgi:site-specific DNA recombinase